MTWNVENSFIIENPLYVLESMKNLERYSDIRMGMNPISHRVGF